MRQSKSFSIILVYIFATFFLPAISAIFLNYFFDFADEVFIAYVNLISYVFLIIVSLSMFGSHLIEDFKKIESVTKFLKGTFIGWGLLLLALISSNLLLLVLTGEIDSSQNQQVIEETLEATPIIMAITTVLLAPLVEEIIFRLTLMKKVVIHPWFGILFSSFLFALIHVVHARDFIFLIPYMAMGVPLGYSYYKTRNICYPIAIHTLQNLFSTIMITIPLSSFFN